METNEILKKYGQTHLLRFVDELNSKEKIKYLDELKNINYELIKNAYEGRNITTLQENIYEPIKSDKLTEKEKLKYLEIGLNAIKNKEVACFLVAGGQGSRLGFNGPKGLFDIGLPSHKTIFQIHIEKLIYIYNKTKTYIPIFIMTSNENNDDTIAFFEKNNYFGYKKDEVFFFKQNALPAFDLEGKIILKNKNEINLSPDGNGGCFRAFKNSGYLDLLLKRNYKWIFLFGVDNILCKVCDPIFIGYTISNNVKGASKVVRKKNPQEKVGILCKKNGHPSIIEYTDLSDELRNLTDKNDELVFSNGNILNHVLHIDFVNQVSNTLLPIHLANKKIEAINLNGCKIKSEVENGYKIEFFLFDTFQYLDEMKVLEIEREEEFAPVKSCEKEDTPEIARDLILNLHKKWLKPFNYEIEGDLDFKKFYDFYDINVDNLDYLKKTKKIRNI